MLLFNNLVCMRTCMTACLLTKILFEEGHSVTNVTILFPHRVTNSHLGFGAHKDSLHASDPLTCMTGLPKLEVIAKLKELELSRSGFKIYLGHLPSIWL